MKALIAKYGTPVPRYTSYPTVPNWNTTAFSTDGYLRLLDTAFAEKAHKGMALYIHLPYCESLCTYCGCNTRITVNHAVEVPYIDAVLAEWQMYLERFKQLHGPTAKPLIREMHLGGGTPTFFAAKQLRRMIEGILDQCRLDADASFSFEAHPANTTEDHLITLRNLGFDRLSLGVQDFNPTVQKAIHRWQSPEEVMKVTAQARALGYRSVNYDLVYGLPFQHHDGFSDTLAQVIAMRPDRIALYAYAHVPWKHPGQRAYDAQDLPAPAEKLALFNMGRDALLKAGYNSIGLDHFALPNDSLSKAYHDGTVHRNFMGYTDLRTDILIGLGVSAISDIGSAYAQNVKTVEHYRALLAQSQSPISKGHMLNNEEITIAAHILNLMCGHKTSWKNANEETRQYFELRKSALSSLAADGLIELDSDSIVVKDKGKVLVRNVCAAIDMHFSPSAGQPKFAAAI